MRIVAAFVAFLLLSCNTSPTDPNTTFGDTTIVLGVGESKQIGTGLAVTFAQVAEDSRCPKSVVCAWQGNGVVRLDVTANSAVDSVRLNTAGGPQFPREATAGSYTFSLVELDPQRETTDPIPAQRYRATVRVTRVP